jgi:glycerophosphoryl diester phosphodiesterase
VSCLKESIVVAQNLHIQRERHLNQHPLLVPRNSQPPKKMRSSILVWAVALIGMSSSYPIPYNDLNGRLEVQGHRGSRGQRTEESLWAFAYAMEIGVDTLEMDTLFTKDEVAVIWHDHSISAEKCSGDFVGEYIANLTLAQIKTLDCSEQLTNYPQSEPHPGTRIATLEEVLQLIDCYGDSTVGINLETKVDPTMPNQTLPVSTYVNNLIPILQQYDVVSRTTIQSFDWRTLIGIKGKYPEVVTVALLDDTTIVPDDTGDFPWLGGVKVVDDDWITPAADIGASVLSPVHGLPSNASVNTPGYQALVTPERVDMAHSLGMSVVPWTVNDEVTINKLVNDGVDSIISDYPERVMWIAKQRGLSSGKARNPSKPECLKNASG